MTHAALWVESCAPSMGWEPGAFLKAYAANREATSDRVLEGNEIVVPLLRLVSRSAEWRGTASELLSALEMDVRQEERRHGWPKNAQALGHALTKDDGAAG